MEEYISKFLEELGVDISDENFRETPSRVIRMYKELYYSKEKREEELNKILNKAFESKYSGIVISKGNRVFTLCPHHLLPVQMDVTVGYIPNGKVLGLSKLVRCIEVIAKQFIMQEDYTEQVVDKIMEILRPRGVGVYIKGLHYCMIVRGVRQKDSVVITTSLRGIFLENADVKQEFLDRCER